MMKRYVIERDLPGVGGLKDTELGGAAKLRALGKPVNTLVSFEGH